MKMKNPLQGSIMSSSKEFKNCLTSTQEKLFWVANCCIFDLRISNNNVEEMELSGERCGWRVLLMRFLADPMIKDMDAGWDELLVHLEETSLGFFAGSCGKSSDHIYVFMWHLSSVKLP